MKMLLDWPIGVVPARAAVVMRWNAFARRESLYNMKTSDLTPARIVKH